MAHYAAFDVSEKETAIHVLDEHGKLVWKGKRPSEPDALAAALRRYAPELVRVGLETGRLAPWLFHSLKELGFPVICLDARHARAATALQRNKTDARDAETLAQLVRTGWYREARVKSWAAHAERHLVGARAQLVGISTDLSNQIRSVLRTFGLRAAGRTGGAFEAKVWKSAWKEDPAEGLIGVQSGPAPAPPIPCSRRVRARGPAGDVDRGDHRQDPAALSQPAQEHPRDLAGAAPVPQGRAQGAALRQDRLRLQAPAPAAAPARRPRRAPRGPARRGARQAQARAPQ